MWQLLQTKFMQNVKFASQYTTVTRIHTCWFGKGKVAATL